MSNLPKPRLLLVEDDLELARLTVDYLQGQGFSVDHLPDGSQLQHQLRQASPELIILDWMLPGTDGYELCRRIRPEYDGRIMMLTAKDDGVDQILALEVGADDYVTKPIEPRVLLSRVRALLRRSEYPPQNQQIRVGALSIDPALRAAFIDGQPIPLSAAEYDLLTVLCQQPGQILSRDLLLRKLRGIPHDGLDRSIDMRVSALRKILGNFANAPKILTVRNTGYQLAVPSSNEPEQHA